jgi:hypothetical protein
MSNLTKHGTFDIDAALADQQEASKGSSDYFKFKNGQNVIRFLPPLAGQSSPFAVLYQHWVTLPDGSRTSLNCSRMMAKQRCPACEEMDRLARSGNEVDFKASNDWKPKLRIKANIIDRDDEDKGVQVVEFGKSILDQLVAIRKDPRAGGDFTDIEDGFDIVVTKKGEGVKTEYACLASRETTALHNDADVAQEWLDNQHDLSRAKYVPTYEEAYARLSGGGRAPADHGRVNSSGSRKPEVLPPASKTGAAKRRSVADDTSDIPF